MSISERLQCDADEIRQFEVAMNELLSSENSLLQTSWCSRMGLACKYLLKENGIAITALYDPIRDCYQTAITVRDDDNRTTTFDNMSKSQISPFLHKWIEISHFNKWSRMNTVGKLANSLSINKTFNRRIMRGELISVGNWFFLHKARVVNLATRVTKHDKKSTNCRNCKNWPETNWHALCLCPIVMRHINTRHNRIVRILAEFLHQYLQPRDNWEILVETQAQHYGRQLVPDIQLKNTFRKHFYIIYVKCAYDREENMVERDRINENINVSWISLQPLI